MTPFFAELLNTTARDVVLPFGDVTRLEPRPTVGLALPRLAYRPEPSRVRTICLRRRRA